MPPITDWPEDERPRERLLALGPQALSDAELLAVFLRIGIRGKSAVDLARECIARFSTLPQLFSAPLAAFSAIPGMGPAKYAQLQAVLELARRCLQAELTVNPSLESPAKVRDFLRLQIGRLTHEVFVVLFLDSQNRLLASEELFRGTLAQTAVYPREIVKRALAHNAASVILSHNHPSGTLEPSQADRILTDALKQALALVDIRVLDHVIVARNQTLSFAERGLI
ncbi:MAG TPA: DNA repair protein RadC [Burkholderiaceae bacterium]|nr:DNA repair protein RadC [Burkholderiaceae bacterium]